MAWLGGRLFRILVVWVLTIFSVVSASSLTAAESGDFDIAPFARRCCAADRHTSQLEFDLDEARNAGPGAERTADGLYIYGLQWTEERDISEVRFRHTGNAGTFEVEYWFRNWPYEPPHMPSIEDPVDDPWNGKWLTATTKQDCHAEECRVTFLPLELSENPLAKNLPGVDYRRTIKLRLVFHNDPGIGRLEVFNGSKIRLVELRVQLGAGEKTHHVWDGTLQVYNGHLERVSIWHGTASDTASESRFRVTTAGRAKGLLVKLEASEPGLAGSNDVTVVTLNSGDRTFSFAVPDVEKGPVYIPAFHAYATLASDPHNFSPSIVKGGAEIRDLIRREPEQTYERASREIPQLDPAHREGERLYLPLAADASWQKFAFEWGGNIHISKAGTKAKGQELKRLEWPGDRIAWRLGTGATPNFRPEWHDSTLSVLDDDLPVVTAKWSAGGIRYTEEGFAALLSGPLSPDDPGRSEGTPAVLMMKLATQNAGSSPTTAHVWIATEPDETVTLQDGELLAQNGQLIRARLQLPDSGRASPAGVTDGNARLHGIHIEIPLEAGQERSTFIELPFVPRLTQEERERLNELDYSTERQRIVAYWQQVVAHAVPFNVPERRFDTFARATIAHIHISTTKDPKSGLYMVPAASYFYQVFANEAAFQCVMLDALGDHQLAAEYLKTFVRLQGSEPFEGTFTGDQSAVYHGAEVDDEYDYTASQYNLDHGTVLWALAEHYLYTRDKQWLRENAASMERAADWVVEQRKLTEVTDGGEKVLEYGLLPAGHLEDNRDWGHWFAVNAFAAAGMTQMARALTDLGSPEAELYTREAAAYVHDLRTAVIRASQRSPVVRLRDNTYVPWVPPVPYQRLRLFGPLRVAYYTRYPQKAKPLFRLAADREVLYGPMILLSMDIFHASEPFANWVLNDWEDNITLSSPLGLNVHGWVEDKHWFSQGGMVFQANLQNPVLVYLRRNEVPAAIRNLYNDFVACYYPDANAFTEEYHQWVHGSGPFYKVPDESRFVNRVRDTMVREDHDTLWLLAGIPRRWLASGQRIQIDGIATYFGPMNLEATASASVVSVRVELPTRNAMKTAWLVVRAPGAKPIKSVEIDGRSWTDFDATGERIRLPLRAGTMQITAHF